MRFIGRVPGKTGEVRRRREERRRLRFTSGRGGRDAICVKRERVYSFSKMKTK